MTPCIATISLSGDLRQKFKAAQSAGFKSIELVEQDLMVSGLCPTDIRRCLADQGLSLAAYQPCRDVEGLPEPDRTVTFDRVSRQLDIAAEVGAEMLLVCSSVSRLASPDPARAAADLYAIADMATARGLRIGYEALSWGRHVSNHAAAWRLVRLTDHPALGLVLDSFHTLAMDTGTDDIPSIPGDRIFMVQIADAPRLRMDILQLSRHYRRLPGLGDLDLPRFLAAVEATGFSGPLSIEVFSDELRAADPVSVASDAMLSLVALRRPDISTPKAPADNGSKLLPTEQLKDLGVAVALQAADPKISLKLTNDGMGPSLLSAMQANTLFSVDHLVLRANLSIARHIKLNLSAMSGLGWQDLPDLPDLDGLIHLTKLDCTSGRLLVSEPAAERADAHLDNQDGARVDHLCFAVNDVVAAAAALTAAGYRLMPVPPSHLMIAGAHAGIDHDTLCKLGAANIAIEGDSSGQFLQVFLAEPVDGAMISLAERRGGYEGLGLGNAGLWLAHRRNVLRV